MKNIIGVVATFIITLIPFIVGAGIGFGITGLMVLGICWAFRLTFSWRMAFGVWLVWIFVSSVFGGKKYVKKVD